MKTNTKTLIDYSNYRVDSHALAARLESRISRVIEEMRAVEGNAKWYGVRRRINKLRAFKLSLMK